jgi:hypothetical protein
MNNANAWPVSAPALLVLLLFHADPGHRRRRVDQGGHEDGDDGQQ